jgi:hypothetical protein
MDLSNVTYTSLQQAEEALRNHTKALGYWLKITRTCSDKHKKVKKRVFACSHGGTPQKVNSVV